MADHSPVAAPTAPAAPAASPAVPAADPVAHLTVDPGSAQSPFEQVRAQLEALIRGGHLLPGDKLPTVRALAGRLGLAANTVARAYKLLEASGLVETHSRAGTTVASGAHAAEAALAALAARFVSECRRAGLDDAAALALVRAAQSAD